MKIKQNILLFLGGRWHDFAGFAQAMNGLFAPQGYLLTETYDGNTPCRLSEAGVDLVISYTCFAEPHPQAPLIGTNRLNATEVRDLSKWVERGGALLAVHASTVLGESSSELQALLGGVFLSHPEPFAFPVYPLFERHPITDGIEPFVVYDEFFIEEIDPSNHLHMVAIDRGRVYPMVWSKQAGKGKIVHIAMGHDQRVWEEPSYQRLLLQATEWLLSKKPHTSADC